MSRAGEALVCPGCGARADDDERFCADCHLPLVFASGAGAETGDVAVSERRRRARLIKPQLTEGPLVKVAWARNQAEGELLQSLLLEAGVPSLLRRSPGFDVPDLLAAGSRDVLVAASGADVAREALRGLDGPAPPVRIRPARLLAGLLLGLALGGLVIWLLGLALGG